MGDSRRARTAYSPIGVSSSSGTYHSSRNYGSSGSSRTARPEAYESRSTYGAGGSANNLLAYGVLDSPRYQSPPRRSTSTRYSSRHRSPPPMEYSNDSSRRDQSRSISSQDSYRFSSRDSYIDSRSRMGRSESLTMDARLTALPSRPYVSSLTYQGERNRRDSSGTHRTTSVSSTRYDDLVRLGESSIGRPGFDPSQRTRTRYYLAASTSSYQPSGDWDRSGGVYYERRSRRSGSRYRQVSFPRYHSCGEAENRDWPLVKYLSTTSTPSGSDQNRD